MRYLSLFSGIEAATAAWHGLGWQCVAVAEVDRFPNKILSHYYPTVPNLGDVTKITDEQVRALGHIDLVVFGSPCQDLSVAGARKGLAGSRSGLFHDAVRIIRASGARFALWENVPGAFSSHKGRDFAVVLASLTGADHTIPTKKWGNEGAAVGPAGMVEWSTLDAQWFGVAQRRRRVFALADFGDWFNRPAVLLEPESLRGDSPPSRETGKTPTHDVAPCIGASGRGFERAGETRGQDPVVAIFGGNNTGGEIDVATACNAKGGSGRMDFESETFVTHTLRGDGFDASEDGAGRGTPLTVVHGTQDPCTSEHVAFALGRNSGQENAIAFSCKDYGADATDNVAPTMRAMNHSGSHANAGGQLAVAVALRGREGGATAELGDEVGHALRASSGGGDKPHILTGMQVRRLTPRECERLQGFTDDFTLIPDGKRMSADGPRYKALGNSMAVPVMRWIGERINAVHTQ